MDQALNVGFTKKAKNIWDRPVAMADAVEMSNVEAVRDIGIFTIYKNVKVLEAGNGGNGGKKSMDGKTGEDLIIKLPIGSVVSQSRYRTKI